LASLPGSVKFYLGGKTSQQTEARQKNIAEAVVRTPGRGIGTVRFEVPT